MFYSKFSIAHYRGFQDEQTLEFGIPEENKPGSGITYIVGENNTGKTTIIEGLMLRAKAKIRSSEKQESGAPAFLLYGENDTKVRHVSLIREGSYTLQEEGENLDQFELVPSRRHWKSFVQRHGHSLEKVASEDLEEAGKLRSGSSVQLAETLAEIESDSGEKFQHFIDLVQKVIPNFSSFAVGYEDAEFIEYTTKDGVKHKSDFLGEGIISILRILVHLFADKSQPLIIDEPELSLHPEAQKRLVKVIAECAQKRQILLSTHSPYFVSWEYIKNGAVLNRVTKHNDKFSEIYTMKPYKNYESLVDGDNWQQPFLMDVVAREIFFHDSILFVEGQEDVGLLKKHRGLENVINFFGYGVRGKDNFKSALHLARDIGIRKAVVILDNGPDEEKIGSDLSNEFSNYEIVQWDKEDIRDKKVYSEKNGECVIKEVSGYFDENGQMKKKEEKAFNGKIEEINKYFTS